MYTLVASLHALGVTVSVIVLNHGALEQKLRHAGIDTIILDETKLNGFRILLKLIRILREQNPDVIHTHRLKENIIGSLAALLAGNTPSVRTVHGVLRRPPFLQVHKRLFYFLNWITGRFLQNRIISVSRELTAILEKDFPLSKIRVIENGIDLDSICKQAGNPGAGQQDNVFRIGIVGRLVSVKRIDIFIGAARHLLKQGLVSDISFYVIGEGPMRKELELLNTESGTEKIVHFLGQQDNVLHHIQNLSVIMMTSDYEGLPMVLLEAMALRVPIIAHKTGGIPGLLDQGDCGILIEEQNPAVYARAAMHLKENPELQTQIVDKAISRVTERYSAKKNAQTCLAEYTSLINP